ncbi:MAG TPA: hypothetical protein VLR29_01765 [Flavobacterium sp.]|nr:hypothetical protein [Flavobacterium sp.]
MKTPLPTFLLQIFFLSFLFYFSSCDRAKATDAGVEKEKSKTDKVAPVPETVVQPIDTLDYNKRVLALSNNDKSGKWPVKNLPHPLPGAILPYNRIIAFYGNIYSKRMGILGELPKGEMLKKLKGEVAKWQAADPATKAIPALHYIAVTAQGSPGKANLYRLRMPFKQIDTIINWAKTIDALVFLDIQVGHSSVKTEAAALENYLKLPNVHLGIDPEFSMKTGRVPGTKVGHFTSQDINDAIEILTNLVRKNNLPPKVLVVHRFTQGMVKDYQKIKITPEVQGVMHMDGFGSKVLKKSTYMSYIFKEPVQFTGFKLFYKNDNKNNWQMYTPEELIKLTPKPSYIQYQ